MAIREFRYTVTPDTITASTVSKGGVQSEHQATKLIFNLDASLQEKLKGLANNGAFYYRFDCYDGAGGKYSKGPYEFDPTDVTEFSHLIEEKQTRYGGTIQVYLVITLVDGITTEDTTDDTTELELYSYCVKLQLKALPAGAEAPGENYESITTLAVEVKSNADIASAAAERAEKAESETKTARAALNGTWIFDGGTPANTNTLDIKIGVDDEISEDIDSTNLVRSRGIKAYVKQEAKNAVDSANATLKEYKESTAKELDILKDTDQAQSSEISDIKNFITGIADYIVKEETFETTEDVGTVNWNYRIWQSGYFELDGKKLNNDKDMFDFNALNESGELFYGDCGSLTFPFSIPLDEIFSISFGFISTSMRNVWGWGSEITETKIGRYFVGRGTDVKTVANDGTTTEINVKGYPTVHITGKHSV